MKSNVRYLGTMPRHALKLTWENGGSHSMDEVFKIFSNYYKGESKLDMQFVRWFKSEYLDKLGRDFELELFSEDFPKTVQPAALSPEEVVELEGEDETEESEGYWDDTDAPVEAQKLTVESSKLEVASSMQEAKDRLRSMRHPVEVGEIDREEASMRQNLTGADLVASLPKAGSSVVTGDDLEARSSIKSSNKQKNITGLMLSDSGDVVSIIPTSKEEQQKRDRKLAGMSGKIQYIDEDTLLESGDSRVITGDSFDSDGEDRPSYKNVTEDNDRKVNKSFKSFPNFNASNSSEILPSHIVEAESERESIRLIKMCKNSTTLKVARIYLQDGGKHKLIEEVEDQLRKIPPGQ